MSIHHCDFLDFDDGGWVSLFLFKLFLGYRIFLTKALNKTFPLYEQYVTCQTRCRAYIFPVVKNVPVDVSAYAQ